MQCLAISKKIAIEAGPGLDVPRQPNNPNEIGTRHSFVDRVMNHHAWRGGGGV